MSTQGKMVSLMLFLAMASVACKNDKKKKESFLASGVAKVVSYSFLDVHDYEFDSAIKGQLLQIMPEYSQYLRKDDPHPKVVLTKPETQKLLGIINTANTYTLGAAMCYFPRNCFVFYNSKGEIIGYYRIRMT